MSSRLERQGVWKRRALGSALLLLLAIGGMRASTAGHVPAAQTGPSPLPMTVCPAGKVAVEPADVGTGEAVRCLPLGDDEVRGSRVELAGLAVRLSEEDVGTAVEAHPLRLDARGQAAHRVPGLEHAHGDTTTYKPQGGGEAAHPRPHDDDRRRHRGCRSPNEA